MSNVTEWKQKSSKVWLEIIKSMLGIFFQNLIPSRTSKINIQKMQDGGNKKLKDLPIAKTFDMHQR